MMKLAMAPSHADLKPTVGFEQGDPFPDFHEGILAWSSDRALTLRSCLLTAACG
jgi:hypothetical protein